MPPLPPSILPTIEAIYQNYEASAKDWRRDHLGASLIGTECERSLWYTFRWVAAPKFHGRMLRLFQTGNKEEERIVDNLRSIGIEVYDRDPNDPSKQIGYSSFGGHFAGSVDAIARGFKESSQWHVLEFKTASDKNFKALCKKGVFEEKFNHFAQMQMYMKWSGLERAYYFCVNKNTDEIYGERVHYRKEYALGMEARAERVIFAEEIPHAISDSGADWRCRFCASSGICHEKRLPEVNCRTCGMVTVLPDGGWQCGRDGSRINRMKQRDGCGEHIFIPCLVPRAQVDANAETGTVIYEGGIENGPGAIASVDMQGVIDNR